MTGTLTRRAAIGIAAMSTPVGLAAVASPCIGAEDGDKPRDSPTVFKIKDVSLDGFNAEEGTLTLSFRRKGNVCTLVNVPVADDMQVRVSHVEPGSVNNLPFGWERVKELAGKRVSVLFRGTADGLFVGSIASAND
jgi:hypothetical protein